MTDSREVHLLSAAHVEGLRALSLEPDVAAAAGIDVALSHDAAIAHIAMLAKAREEGQSYVFVLTDKGAVSGICRLIGVRGVPRLIVAVAAAYRGQGNGAFLVRHVLAFAFDTLGVDRVTASGPCLVLVSRYGRLEGNGLNRQDWNP